MSKLTPQQILDNALSRQAWNHRKAEERRARYVETSERLNTLSAAFSCYISMTIIPQILSGLNPNIGFNRKEK